MTVMSPPPETGSLERQAQRVLLTSDTSRCFGYWARNPRLVWGFCFSPGIRLGDRSVLILEPRRQLRRTKDTLA
ncbi:unannotated protein [freshwater metagenome]|uniref:Unannotated protein n=1 Tax=freshwater metagenome TaxID=449393 RepID=A0A6J6T9Y4_9ZZZZ